ncbi:hypothetical protein H7F51_12970 [Novosphingobium flavum]|uniref:Tetratricopeptide repeat protein n=1 Tax=Novosphingobium flavum TaxID=1778672 RepID=A0A7X1KMA9_9SPHN|nr:hypothetical protein [Novosphingobium flavum]MBC2666434.1 hypothetical protein [Novosphingobium flavum]
MFPNSKRARSLSRAAMAAALALGAAGGATLVATPAMAQKQAKPQLSPAFSKLAAPLQNGLNAAQKAKPDAAGIAALKQQAEAALAAATTPDDKFFGGQFAIQASQLDNDKPLQRKGLQAAVDSGKMAGADLGKFQFFLGANMMETKDYAGAQAAFNSAISNGYTGNDIEVLLAETYFGQQQNQAGYDALAKAIEAKKAAGTPAPQEWFARGISVAYRAKQYDQALRFGTGLAATYPTKDNWGDAISIARLAGKYQAQETLDLMRLMGRTGSFRDTSDYSEYLQAADARRAPGEVLKVLDAGVAAGKLNASDVFVTENRTQANARLAADKAGLPSLDKDAHAPAATGATVVAAADAFLSYDDNAKAEELYKIALTKPGIDKDRALTRLGIAQVGLGKYADAQASFGQIGGVRKPIAALWTAYAAQKAKGG